MSRKDTKELLVDTFAVKFNLCEDKGNKFVGKGVFARAGVPTANRRIYPESVWRKNINKLQEDIKARKVLMSADHPDHGKTKLVEAAAVLTGLKLESNGDIIGEMEIIEGTPNGKILSALVDANCTIGVSSRGYGSVKMNESGQDVVQDDYVLMTFDAVSDPANATSWPEFSKEGEAEESKQVDDKKVLNEDEEWTPEKGELGQWIANDEWIKEGLYHIKYDFDKKIRKDTNRGPIAELDVDMPLPFLYWLEKQGFVKLIKPKKLGSGHAVELTDKGENKLSELNKKESNMAEEKDDNKPESPKKAAEELPIVPSPKPYVAPENPKKYYGIFLKNDKDEYDNTTAKFIFTNKEDADEMAKQLTTDSDSKEKNVFVAKEIDYSEALKTERKQEYVVIIDGETHGPFANKESADRFAKQYEDEHKEKVLVKPYRGALKTEGIIDDQIKPWLSDIEGAISDLEFYLPKTKDKSEHSKMQRMLISLKAVKNMLAEMKEDNAKLTVAAKEMGFRYFLEKNLSHHPKYQDILQSLGKLTKYESIEELKNLVKIHIEDANEFVKVKQIQVEQKLQKIENEFMMKTEEFRQAIKAKDALVESKEKELKSLRDDLAQLRSELTEEKTKVYLERKIQGLPNAFAIREAYEKSGIVGNKIVDRLVESMVQPKEMVTEASVFNQVRASLGKRQLPLNNLVENSVKGTTKDSIKKLTEEKTPINQSLAEFNKLAGLSN